MTSSSLSPQDALRSGLDDIWLRIHGKHVAECIKGFKRWSSTSKILESNADLTAENLPLLLFLKHEIDERFKKVEQLRNSQAKFNYNYLHSEMDTERIEHLVAAVKFLAYPSRIVRKVSKGKLEWFDEAAVSEYYEKKISEQEQFIAFMIERLCHIVRSTLEGFESDQELITYWRIVELPDSLTEALSYQPLANIRIAACKGLRRVLIQLPDTIKNAVSDTVIRDIYRICLDESMHIWMRAEMMTLIAVSHPQQYLDIFRRIFSSNERADIFLKGRMIEILLRYVPITEQSLGEGLLALSHEPSEYVRQRFAESARYLEPDVALQFVLELLQSESSGKVKAQLVLTLLDHEWEQSQLDIIIDALGSVLQSDADEFLLRTVLHVLPQFQQKLTPTLKISQEAIEKINQQLTWLNMHHEHTKMRRWAAECREAVFYYYSRAAFNERQRQCLIDLPMEKSTKLVINPNQRNEDWYRQLAFIAAKRFGFDVEVKGDKANVRAGFMFRTRLWRIMHEWRRPATDKRQNHNHIKGRVYYGLEQFNTRLVSEQSITKVPGEPVYIHDEAGERNFLPLVDQLISCLDQGWPTKPMRIFSSEGVTAITPPSSLLARFKARWLIQLNFAKLSRLRNWHEGDNFEANAYLKKVSQLGFKISIRGYADTKSNSYPVEPRVTRFFPSVVLPFSVPTLDDAYDYFYSVYQNTITQLLAFTAVVFVGFYANHVRQLVDFKRHRRRLPLVIGGWGTRGKSGTERLKAAVLQDLGLSVLSKTTGCEAMFVYGHANRPMRELFLFRPYDKATIWEQVFLTKFAAKLGADAFLWECMGLTPRYIEILQSQWMRDDISTITNCYPDHEDIQGPAGIEIPIVMQNFIVKKGDVFTTEESMLPVLQDAAHRKQAKLTAVTWLKAGLITDDVLERFPYAEHPNNIALVQEMSERLGVRNDVAVKAMADNVIPDLGVLKVYPTVSINGRRIEFVNGMSANERLGALGNWERTGLAEHNLDTSPEIWTGIVVNNRADRVARSQVFAEMLVADIQADRYYFIGDNLDGFQTYIREAWETFSGQLKGSDQQQPEEQFTSLCNRFRIATDLAQLEKRIAAALQGVGVDDSNVKEFFACISQWKTESDIEQSFSQIKRNSEPVEQTYIAEIAVQAKQMFSEYTYSKQFRGNGSASDKDRFAEALDWIFSCFEQRWVIVDNYYSTGNETLKIVIDTTVPGLHARVIGVQNIKGTGLDFIYRWQAWDRVYSFAKKLRESNNLSDVQLNARALATWQEYGILDREFIVATIEIARNRQICQQESIQADLTIVEKQLLFQLEEIESSMAQGSIDSGIGYKLISAFEDFLDSGNAIKRRNRSQAIYKAMLDNVISMDRAAAELGALNKAQKGGWLMRSLKRRFSD